MQFESNTISLTLVCREAAVLSHDISSSKQDRAACSDQTNYKIHLVIICSSLSIS